MTKEEKINLIVDTLGQVNVVDSYFTEILETVASDITHANFVELTDKVKNNLVPKIRCDINITYNNILSDEEIDALVTFFKSDQFKFIRLINDKCNLQMEKNREAWQNEFSEMIKKAITDE
jgi:hypothetical protein